MMIIDYVDVMHNKSIHAHANERPVKKFTDSAEGFSDMPAVDKKIGTQNCPHKSRGHHR